jgi:tetratricopeptide (TPR) repeat protein
MYEAARLRWRTSHVLVPILGLLMLVVVGLCFQSGCGGSSRSLVLVTVDGLRADHVNAETAPQWSALAAGGVRLDSLYTTCPSALPALTSLMTGEDPDELGSFFGDLTRLPPDVSTLAERLRDAGYKTTAYVGEGSVPPSTGIARGFDTFVSPSGPLRQALLATESGRAKPRHSGLFAASDVIEMVGRHLRKQTLEDRFFVWVHLGDLDELGVVEDPKAAYLEILTRIDRVIGDLEDALMTYGLSDRTLLAATSLSGVSLGEGGERGHGLRLDEAVVRIPAFVSGPGAEQARRALPGDGRPASIADLKTALLQALELDTAGAREADLTFVGTRIPSRQYGWPDLAAVGGEEGWLRLTPQPTWQPAGASSSVDEGQQALEAAPDPYRARLEKAGFLPATEHPAHPEEERVRILSWIAQAHTQMARGEIDDAVGLLQRAAAAAPEAPGPRSALLMLASGLPEDLRRAHAGAIERAASELQKLTAGSRVRKIDQARGLALIDRCGDALRIVAQVAEEARSGEKLALASLAGSCGSAEQAAGLLEEVAAEAERTPALDEWRGDILAGAGNAFRAKQAYQQALEAGREHPGLIAKLGDQLAALGELDAALQHYAKAQQLDPSYLYPHQRAAAVLLEQGERGAAAHALVLSTPDRGDPVRNALARARVLAGRELYEAALQELERGLSEAPGNLRLEIRHARILIDAGRFDQAASELADLRERSPRDPRVLVESARLAARLQNENEALSYLEAAEPLAGPPITRLVRRDPVFRSLGADSALAAFARGFTGEVEPAPRKPQAAGDD